MRQICMRVIFVTAILAASLTAACTSSGGCGGCCSPDGCDGCRAGTGCDCPR